MQPVSFKFIPFWVMTIPLFMGCSNKPTEEEFKALILSKGSYPVKREITINLNNTFMPIALKKENLDQLGYVKFNTTFTEGDKEVKPLVEFTAKAQPFLIGKPSEHNYQLNQQVATYTSEFNKIGGVKFNGEENKAVVEFNEKCMNVTPFANVGSKSNDRITEGSIRSYKAYFSKYEDGWKLEENPGTEFASF